MAPTTIQVGIAGSAGPVNNGELPATVLTAANWKNTSS
jgi:hypothetical protein